MAIDNPADDPAEDPWVVLGIAPTEQLRAVKAAYFSALPRVPPHADPVGFRRLRKAYEALTAPGALAASAWRSAPDLLALERSLEAEFAAHIAASLETSRLTAARKRAHARVTDRYGSVSWMNAVLLARAARLDE